ncbi:MAG: hypothetical protein M1825_006138 [Sarcosagium campestre]|nr:MAG: hypothetical protein M1825_006138 [Sarcosagium campestre]
MDSSGLASNLQGVAQHTTHQDVLSSLRKMEAFMAYLGETLETQRSDIDRLSNAMENVQDDMADAQSAVQEVRLQLRNSTSLRPNDVASAGDLELLASSVSGISRKANEVDALRMELDLLKSRIKRMDDGLRSAQPFSTKAPHVNGTSRTPLQDHHAPKSLIEGLSRISQDSNRTFTPPGPKYTQVLQPSRSHLSFSDEVPESATGSKRVAFSADDSNTQNQSNPRSKKRSRIEPAHETVLLEDETPAIPTREAIDDNFEREESSEVPQTEKHSAVRNPRASNRASYPPNIPNLADPPNDDQNDRDYRPTTSRAQASNGAARGRGRGRPRRNSERQSLPSHQSEDSAGSWTGDPDKENEVAYMHGGISADLNSNPEFRNRQTLNESIETGPPPQRPAQNSIQKPKQQQQQQQSHSAPSSASKPTMRNALGQRLTMKGEVDKRYWNHKNFTRAHPSSVFNSTNQQKLTTPPPPLPPPPPPPPRQQQPKQSKQAKQQKEPKQQKQLQKQKQPADTATEVERLADEEQAKLDEEAQMRERERLVERHFRRGGGTKSD